MFTVDIEAPKEVKWPAKINVAENGGKIGIYDISLIFKALDEDQIEALNQAAEGMDASTAMGEIEKTAFIMEGWMSGWDKLQTSDNKKFEFTPDNLRALLKSSKGMPFRVAFYKAVGEVRSGAKAKN